MVQDPNLQLRNQDKDMTINGWKSEQIELFKNELKNSSENGMKLKEVFEKVAESIGKKPNSVRNFYYMYLKEKQSQISNTEIQDNIRFITFSEQEKKELLVKMLQAQANGISVRKCAMDMAGNDKGKMLRYQNKYRNLLKSHQGLVKSTIDELRNQGKGCYDPFTGKIYKAEQCTQPGSEYIVNDTVSKQQQKTAETNQNEDDFVEIISGIIKNMENLKNVNIVEMFKALSTLTGLASMNIGSRKKIEEYDSLAAKYDLLVINAEKMEKELHQKSNISKLLSMLRQLITINKGFLLLNPVNKVSNLNVYTNQLTQCVQEYENVVNQYN